MKLSLGQIAEIVGGEVVQQGGVSEVAGVASLADATMAECSFLGNPKYFQDFLTSEAGVVLVPSAYVKSTDAGVSVGDKEVRTSMGLVSVENPSYAFAAVVERLASAQRRFQAGVHPRAYVHESVKFDASKVSVKAGAVVEAGCEIGDGTVIGCGVVIGEGVKIGEDCLMHPNVTVREYCQIGDRVILQPNCVIGSDGYGYELVEGQHEKVAQVGIVVLGNDVEIGSSTCVDRARFGRTVIGAGTKIDNLVQIAHNVQVGEHSLIVSQTGVAGSSKIGNNVTIAAQCGVTGHIEVGDQSIIAARSGVTKTLAGKETYGGYPIRKYMEDKRIQVSISKLPQFLKELKVLKKALEEQAGE